MGPCMQLKMIITLKSAQTLPLYSHAFKCEEDHSSAIAALVLFPNPPYWKCRPKGITQQHAWLLNERKALSGFFLFTPLISLHGIIIHLMSWNNVIMKLAQLFFHWGNIIRKVLLSVLSRIFLLSWHISYTFNKSPHYVKTAIRATG